MRLNLLQKRIRHDACAPKQANRKFIRVQHRLAKRYHSPENTRCCGIPSSYTNPFPLGTIRMSGGRTYYVEAAAVIKMYNNTPECGKLSYRAQDLADEPAATTLYPASARKANPTEFT